MTGKHHPSELAAFLKTRVPAGTSFVQRLKIVYRPYICPLDQILEFVPPGASVFDIGCGAGTLLLLIAEFRSPRTLAGIEIRDSLVETARAILEPVAGRDRVHVEVYDGENIPESIGRSDTVILNDVLHHIRPERQESFLRQIHRKMRPGGVLILKDIDRERPILCLFNKLHDRVLSGELGNERRSSETLGWLIEMGFQTGAVEKHRQWLYPHYFILATKPAGKEPYAAR